MFQIIQGSKASIPVKFRDQNDNPVDLTGVTEIQTCFQNEDGSELVLKYSTSNISIVGNPILGQIAIALTAADTAALSTGDIGTLEIALTYSGDPQKIQIVNAYEVLPTVC